MDAIQTIGLCKRYGNKNAVNNLSIQVPKGSVYGFIGRNGAGKSTTQRMICGLASPTAGEIKLFERPVTDPAVRRKIGTLIEQPGIYPGMSALENVILQGYSIGLENPKKSALEALDAVGLSKAVKKKAKHLSLGMKQRLGLAIAKEIMESHGGKLTAESEYGKGTTMIMWFPKERPILEYEREEQKA